MKHLLTLDNKDYDQCTKLFEVTHSRAVICKDREYAMQRASNGEFKFPGGRMEKGEGPIETLNREVLEETGLYVEEDSIEEIGEIIEIRKDIYDEDTKYICHNYYYSCSVKDRIGEVNLTDKEKQNGLTLCWADLGRMIKDNKNLQLNESRIRDTVFMEKFLPYKH